MFAKLSLEVERVNIRSAKCKETVHVLVGKGALFHQA